MPAPTGHFAEFPGTLPAEEGDRRDDGRVSSTAFEEGRNDNGVTKLSALEFNPAGFGKSFERKPLGVVKVNVVSLPGTPTDANSLPALPVEASSSSFW